MSDLYQKIIRFVDRSGVVHDGVDRGRLAACDPNAYQFSYLVGDIDRNSPSITTCLQCLALQLRGPQPPRRG